MSCTSKCRMFSTRLPASRATANASGRSWSSAAWRSAFAAFTAFSSTGTSFFTSSSACTTGRRRARNSSVFARRPSSERRLTSGSSALISATMGRMAFTSRSCFEPNIMVRTLSIIQRNLIEAETLSNQGWSILIRFNAIQNWCARKMTNAK
jgi:hypothetical protein